MRGVLGLARSLEGRTVVVLLLAVLLVHGGALAIYRLSAVADPANHCKSMLRQYRTAAHTDTVQAVVSWYQ